MLSYNVAALLRAEPGTERRYPVEEANLEIADDLRLAAPIQGEVRLSRTGRSILARAHLTTAIDGLCGRCLTAVVTPIDVDIEEVALPSIDIDTGLPLDPAEVARCATVGRSPRAGPGRTGPRGDLTGGAHRSAVPPRLQGPVPRLRPGSQHRHRPFPHGRLHRSAAGRSGRLAGTIRTELTRT